MKTGKGGGSAKPPAATPAKPAKSAEPAAKSAPAKPAAGKPASPSRKPARDDDDDDDPFSEPDDDPFTAATKQDAANKANAISVSVKKTKTHVVELKCPMCDTVGFVPENSGGKDVKCSNPSCTVPVFMAPKRLGAPAPTVAAPKAKAVKKAPENSKKPLILAIVGGVALVAVVGLAVLFWPDASGGSGKEINFEQLAKEAKAKREAAGLPDPEPTTNGNATGPSTKPKLTDSGQPDPAKPELDVALLLKLMDDYSLEEQLANKKYCRQRAAIGFAVRGDAAGMQGQFQKLDTIEATLQHFKIPAHLTLGWGQLSAGDKAGAAKTADEALAATVRVGKGSRDTQEAIIDLAAFLVALGKSDAAKTLLSEHFVQDASTPLVVATAHARHRRTFDLDAEVPGTIGNPQAAWAGVGVTLILTDEGYWTEAQQWAEAVPDGEGRTDALLAWADAKARDAIARQQAFEPAVEAIGEKLSPGGKVQLLARLALTAAEAGKGPEAERLVAAAQAALTNIPVPPAARTEGFKEALDWKAPEAVPLRQAVLGAAVLGQAQARIKKPEEGWNSFIKALKLARAIAPSPASVEHWKAKADQLGSDGLRDEVRKLLSLSSRDEAQRKARELKNKLDAMQGLGGERFQLQEAILKDAVAAGLTTHVWRETLSLSERNDPNELEPYLDGTLPQYLIQRFTADGNAKESLEVRTRFEGVQLPTEEILEIRPLVATALKSQNFGAAVVLYNQRKLAGETEELALRSFSQSAKQSGQAVPTLLLAMTMDTKTNNQFVKWEAIRMVAAWAARQGDYIAVQDAIQSQKLKPIEKISGFLGLLEGHAAWQKAQSAPAIEGKQEAAKPGK